MLEGSEISKSFKQHKVLDKVSFHLYPNSLNGIVGENGAGKSTLLKIITGEVKADHGVVKVDGKMGYCPQESLVFSMLTVAENFEYFAAAYNLVPSKKWIGIRDGLIKEFSLLPAIDQQVNTLSGGTRQKLNLSISLLHDPEILILDEPYGGFDWESYKHFWRMIMQQKEKGKTILVVTHLLNDLSQFDQVLTLKEGKLQ